MTYLLKEPGSALDYRMDWGVNYLGGDRLIESSWSIIPIEGDGITVDGSAFDATTATVQVSGGRVGKIYRLLNQIVTELGREDGRSIVIRVEDR